MANIRKVFNFREGVQVDETTFVVNGSLVGIGTSLPSDFFDVRNNSSFSGVITASNNVFISAASTFSDRLDVGTFRFEDGVVQASSGVVTFVGDGNLLTNIPTSQWVDVDTGIGVSSVYNGGNVGIATTSPQYELQVGDYAEGGGPTDRGVGINYGDIILTGVVTATSFLGSGQNITNLDAANIVFNTIDNDRIPLLELSKIPTIPDTKLEQNLQLTGIVTALGGFIGSISPTPGDDQPFVFSNVFVEAGLSTFFDVTVLDTLTATASTARGLTGTPDIRVGLVSANNAELGIAVTVQRTNSTEYVSTGILTVTDTVSAQPYPVVVGNRIFKVGGSNDDPLVGIGSADPNTSLNVRAASNADIELLADSGSAAIYLGNSKAAGVDRADLTYNAGALEIANEGTSDIILHVNKDNTGNGGFFIRRGNPADEWLSLDNTGQLGVGVSIVTAKLDVDGSGRIRGDLTVNGAAAITGGDLEILGGIRYNTTSGISTAFDLDVSGRLEVSQNVDISGDVNVGGGLTYNTTAGVSTAFDLDITNNLFVSNATTLGGPSILSDTNINSLSGINTIRELSVVAGLEVGAGVATFTGDVDIAGGITYNTSSGVSTAFRLDVSDNLFVLGDIVVDGTIFGKGELFANATAGIATFYDVDITRDLTVGNVFPTTLTIPDNTPSFADSGISTFFNVEITNSLNIDQLNDFNHNTTTGITTFNELNVKGEFRPENGNFAVNQTTASDGISTFNQLNITGDTFIGGKTRLNGELVVVGDAFIPSGFGTFGGLEVTASGISVTGDSNFANEVTFTAAFVAPSDQEFNINSGISTFNDVDLLGSVQALNTVAVSTVSNTELASGFGVTTFELNGSNQVDVIGVMRIYDEPLPVATLTGDIVLDYARGIGFGDPTLAGGNGLIEDSEQPLGPIDCSRVADGAMYPPKLTTTQRDSEITGIALISGALIYNTSNNRLELYNGDGWVGIATTA